MELIENFNDAAKFTGRLIGNIGNLIMLIIVAIIPIVDLIFLGYVGKIIKEGKNIDSPPTLSNYVGLFVDGLKIVVAAIVYLLVPIVVVAVIVAISMPVTGLELIANPLAFAASLLAAVGATLIIAFAFMIFGVVAIGNMIRSGKFTKIFAFGENWRIISKIGVGKYLAWLICAFLLGIICGGFSSIPAIGWVIGAIVGVFFGVFVARSLARWLDVALEASLPPVIPQPPSPPS
ncbi:MAG: DUF4013 domain-containing protein [Nitrososphaeria archaeon]